MSLEDMDKGGSNDRTSGSNEIGYTRIKRTVSAALLHRIGDELIKDPQTAFCELVKNGFDADATEVLVSFRKTGTKDGIISIQDNGTGMTEEDIETKWSRGRRRKQGAQSAQPQVSAPKIRLKRNRALFPVKTRQQRQNNNSPPRKSSTDCFL